MPSPSERNDAVVRAMGPDAYDPPVMPMAAHPFFSDPLFPDSRFCGLCGGGLLHRVHAADLQEAA